jgi:hypothetical protein
MFRPFICINLVCLQAATQSTSIGGGGGRSLKYWAPAKRGKTSRACPSPGNWIGFKWSKRFHIFSSSICWIVEQLSCHLLSTTLWDSMDENAQCPMPNFVAPAACAAFSTASCCTFGKFWFIDTPNLEVYRSIEGMGNSSTLQKTIPWTWRHGKVLAKGHLRVNWRTLTNRNHQPWILQVRFPLNTGHRTVELSCQSRLKSTVVSTVSTVSSEPHPVSHRSVWTASHSSPWRRCSRWPDGQVRWECSDWAQVIPVRSTKKSPFIECF